MESARGLDCVDALLDLVWYESVIRRLSPEMQDMLERHLRECDSCRQKMLTLGMEIQNLCECPNFG